MEKFDIFRGNKKPPEQVFKKQGQILISHLPSLVFMYDWVGEDKMGQKSRAKRQSNRPKLIK